MLPLFNFFMEIYYIESNTFSKNEDEIIIFFEEYIMTLWIYSPMILWDNKDVIPNENMTNDEKINAITRLIIIVGLVGFGCTCSLQVLFMIGILLFGTYILLHVVTVKESFNTKNEDTIALANSNITTDLKTVLKTEFQNGTKRNPFANVLLTEINDNPDRLAAPPAFNVDVDENITKSVKNAVQMMNPTLKNTNKQLYGDLYQEFELKNANRQFYSTPNTRVVNDQGAFAQYLYGYMPSAKESTPDGNAQRYKDNYRYILY